MSILKTKRSTVAGVIPAASSIVLGELALNTEDGYLYAEKLDGTTVQRIGTTADRIRFLQSGTGAIPVILEDKLRKIPCITEFGASSTASAAQNAVAIQKAFSSGHRYMSVPDDIFDCGNSVIYVDHNDFMLVGKGMPTVDFSTNSFTSGPVIKATIASSGFNGISLKNIGIDSKLSSLTEGFTITNCNDVCIENVVVLGSDENNHCGLIENARSVKVDNFMSFGGKQGLAVKAIDFFVSNVKSYDTLTYGFTARFSPGAACYNGFIKNISCQKNLLPKSGGFILMNDQSGAAIRDLVIDGLIVDNCKNGVYITNTSNDIKATRIKFSNVIIKNVADYAFQTFGNIDAVSVDGIEFEECGGTFLTNQATGTTRLTVSNLKQKNAGIAILSGSGHKLYNWEKSGGGGFFGQNTSSNLEYYGMDATVTPFANITDVSGTGTISRKIEYPSDINIAANGLLYSMRYQCDRIKTIAATLTQNSVTNLFSLPNTDDCVSEITINVLSNAGRHCAKYLICGTVVTKVSANTNSDFVFDIILSGSIVQFKYKWTVTAATYVNCIYSIYGQDS